MINSDELQDAVQSNCEVPFNVGDIVDITLPGGLKVKAQITDQECYPSSRLTIMPIEFTKSVTDSPGEPPTNSRHVIVHRTGSGKLYDLVRYHIKEDGCCLGEAPSEE